LLVAAKNHGRQHSLFASSLLLSHAGPCPRGDTDALADVPEAGLIGWSRGGVALPSRKVIYRHLIADMVKLAKQLPLAFRPGTRAS